MLRRLLLIPALLAGSGCRTTDPVIIGDAYPRPRNVPSIVDVVREALDSSPRRIRIGIEPWSIPSLGDLNAASAQAERFVTTPRLIGVVGHAGSRDALLAANVYNAAGVSQLIPNATSRRLSTAGRWTFMLVPHDGIEGAALAHYALDSLHLPRVTVMYLGDEYGSGLRDGVAEALEARGLRLTDQVMVSGNSCGPLRDGPMTRLVAQASIRRAPPEVVVLAVGSPVAACLARVIAEQRPDMWFLGADGVVASDSEFRFHPPANRPRVRVIVFQPPAPDSAALAYFARARRILGREPTHVESLAYDGFMVLAAAVEATGGGREAVRRWLAELGDTRPAWRGVTGPIGFHSPRAELLRFVGLPEPPP